MGGMRVSDIVTLEWKHIDFETKTLTKLQIKTRRILRIPIVDEAIEILNRWKKKKVNHRIDESEKALGKIGFGGFISLS